MSNKYTSACHKSSGSGAVFVMAAALALSACHRVPPAPAAPAVVVAQSVEPVEGGTAESLRYPVEAAPRYSTSTSFRVGGKIVDRRVRLGDIVHKGQILARLDPADAMRQAAAARAALDAAAHRLEYARLQLARDESQFAQHLIAESSLEQTRDAYSAASAGREQTADQFAVAENTLRYHTLLADHDGTITSEAADTGQVVAAGQAVYGLAWRGDVDVVLDAAAADLTRLAIGQHAAVTFSALPGRRFDARVREVAPAADPQSRTYRIKLTLIADATTVPLGITGAAVFAAVAPTDSNQTPLYRIPATALFHQAGSPAVWVIRADSTLELRPVTARSYTDRSAIVTGPLPGDQLVIAGVHTVFAGERVRAVKPLFADDAHE